MIKHHAVTLDQAIERVRWELDSTFKDSLRFRQILNDLGFEDQMNMLETLELRNSALTDALKDKMRFIDTAIEEAETAESSASYAASELTRLKNKICEEITIKAEAVEI